MNKSRFITRGFLAAGLVNVIGVLIFSLAFTNTYLSELYPQVFSSFGLVVIILWGIAYIAVSQSYRHVRWLIAVFTLEKLVYVISWIVWLGQNGAQLPIIFDTSSITGIFYATYGVFDIIFGLFFLRVFFVIK